ncbi:helix-turn-helix domain-containing protein [Alcanivorax jadensis T9]|jgi:AraC-like DNA-binding protein|uniref:Helix-turn-helix domain-containing protein n=1 Tax=Alcanivorax jadensis T9 TaxID=1177181 RepID=A0ABR4WBJ0_9GAMM|nr:AraC family transcriptional regulator [Alcanivorax jadensis]KGD60585.1 helix-turn-helix domain-containing protein [Alcanivorax jadensis T9]MBP21931.1 AraC family transcriptional regulator [Alcanivorax sp.]
MDDNTPPLPDVPLTPLFLWQGGWLMVMPAIDNQPHQHVAASLLVGLEQPIRVTVEGRLCQQRVVLVPPDVPQSLNSQGPVAVVHLDPDEPAWRALCRLDGLDEQQQRWCGEQIAALVQTGSESQARQFLHGLRGVADPLPLDPRIADACSLMRAGEAVPSMDTLAAHANLSASRFRHLFREQLGVSLKRYQLHLKCQRALALWRSGMNFTDLAVAAGFYDQPHLNRTLRAMFDALPSRYARGLPVQVVHLKE